MIKIIDKDVAILQCMLMKQERYTLGLLQLEVLVTLHVHELFVLLF